MEQKSFSLGLVMAGAATGGSYSAGVVDFLLEALFEWEKAKQNKEPGVPTHNVNLRVISGTSAGAITSTVAVSSLCAKGHTPVPSDFEGKGNERPQNNKLWDVWVEGLRLEKLLAVDDLQGTNPTVQSIASSTFVPDLAREALNVQVAPTVPKFAQELDLFSTVANLRGIPYEVRGVEGVMMTQTLYNDYMRYSFGGKENRDDAFALSLQDDRKSEVWQSAVKSASASGAFPLVFGAVTCIRPRSQYTKRFPRAQPAFPDDAGKTYEFHAVDGGLFNIRPLDLTRDVLMKAKEEEYGESHWSFAKKAADVELATIMVDPFPTRAAQTEAEYHSRPRGIFHFLGEMLDSLVENGRFQEEEIEGAFDDTDYSKFIISPRRRGSNDASVEPALASSGLSHFAGVLDRKLRVHDFCIGRRNAQKFLRSHFVLPKEAAEENDVIDTSTLGEDASADLAVPIIPLVGTAAKEIPQPPWPSFSELEKSQIVDSSKELLETRLEKVMEVLMDDFGNASSTETVEDAKAERSVFGAVTNAVGSIVSPVRRAVEGMFRNVVLRAFRGAALRRAVTSFENAVRQTLKDF